MYIFLGTSNAGEDGFLLFSDNNGLQFRFLKSRVNSRESAIIACDFFRDSQSINVRDWVWEKWEMKSGSPDGVRRSNCILWSISSNAWRDPIRIKQLESRKQTRFWSCRLLCSSKSLATLYSPPRLRHKWNFQFKNIFLISSKSANVEVALEWRRFAQINQASTDGTNKRNQCQMATYNWFNYWY